MAAKRLIRCFQVYGYVIPCPGSRRGGPITKRCCSGSKSLIATTQDRRTKCGASRRPPRCYRLSTSTGLANCLASMASPYLTTSAPS
ncbi:hypothetical protein GW17_00052472 [Ensete ventricosum]|nr:hypothetical protein GW17_00052472 [Ensete ventricosum]